MSADHEADQIATLLANKLAQRSRNLTEAFRRLDKSSTGFLSPDDFEATLRNYNICLLYTSDAADE